MTGQVLQHFAGPIYGLPVHMGPRWRLCREKRPGCSPHRPGRWRQWSRHALFDDPDLGDEVEDWALVIGRDIRGRRKQGLP